MSCPLLEPDDAVVAVLPRARSWLLTEDDRAQVMAEMYGKVTGCSRGHGGSDAPVRQGARLLRRQRDRGRRVSRRSDWHWPMRCWTAPGDGVLLPGKGRRRGEWHGPEPRNCGDQPVLFVCENLSAMGTALSRSGSGPTWRSRRLPGYRLDGRQDGCLAEWLMPRAGRWTRSAPSGGPHFLEAVPYRFRATRCSIRSCTGQGGSAPVARTRSDRSVA